MTERDIAQRCNIVPLRGRRERVAAADLLASAIPRVRRERLSPGEDLEVHDYMRRVMTSLGAHLPTDIWLGAWDGRQLVGAVHAGALLEQAVEIAQRILAGQVGAGSPGWLIEYVQRCINVDELAVAETYRGHGIGGGLIEAVHVAALADSARDVRHVTAFAGSPEALATFRKCGYTIGASRMPVPPQFAEGLGTTWDPELDALGGAYVYRHLSAPRPGAAFFR